MRPSFFNDNNPFAQLALTILTCLSCLLLAYSVGAFLSSFIFHIHPVDVPLELSNLNNVPLQKFFQAIEGFGFFIIPSFILALVFSGNSLNYLQLNQFSIGYKFLIVLLIMFFSVPLINLIANLNAMIRLPDFMAGAQQYMDEKSKTYKAITESYLKVQTLKGLGINLLVVALIPAIGEELLFRGVLQRIFSNWTRSAHWGIIITAFIFSAIHVEFNGFFPRWLLGIMFGYFLFWSGSIWLPIFAHFLNNATAVIVFYFISKGTLNEKMTDIGSKSDALPFAILSLVLTVVGIYMLYKKRKVA